MDNTNYIVHIEDSKSSKATMKVNNIYVHSKYNPIVESEKIAQTNYEQHYTYIVFGYGLGYIVDELLKKITEESIIVIDPLVQIGKIQMRQEHIDHPKVVYWNKEDNNTLQFVIEKNTLGLKTMVKIVCTPNYNKLFVEEYANLLKEIRTYLVRTRVNINTIVLCSEQWQKNLSLNLLNIAKDESLAKLHQKYNCPIVVASGGPSLTKQLPLLKQIQDKVLIIAAGTTINSLLAHGIEPHYVVSIDGSETNYNHFKDLKLEKTKLIYSQFSHWKIRSSFKKGYPFASKLYSRIGEYIYRTVNNNLPLIVGGATVAHYAYSIAQLITSGPIALIGQDLAYTNNLSHAGANKGFKHISEDEPGKNNKFFYVEGYYGDKVKTDGPFMGMIQTFEEMMRFYPPIMPVYNCTEGGAKIRGFEQIPFTDFVEKYARKDIEVISDERENQYSIDKEQLIIKFENELKVCDDLINIASKGLEVLRENKYKTHFSQESLEELDIIEAEIVDLTKDIQIDFLVQPLFIRLDGEFLEKENETQEEAYNRVYNQTQTLYKEIVGIVEKSIINIKDLLELLRNEEKYNERYNQ